MLSTKACKHLFARTLHDEKIGLLIFGIINESLFLRQMPFPDYIVY